MIKLFEPYVSEQAKQNVLRVLSGSQLAQGPEVDLFEQEFAAEFGFEAWQIVSVNSGSSALELAYELADIGPDNEVITPILTCTATNIPLVRLKTNIVFCDIGGLFRGNGPSLNMYPNQVENLISKKTKAVVFVHFGGSSVGLDEIEAITEKAGVDLICDAAQALGAPLSRKARFSAISLQAIKSLTAGDGGILICRDKEDADKARKLRWFGYDRGKKQQQGDTDLEIPGYKYHMNDISAAIARGNLSEWNSIIGHRRAINAVYAKIGANKGYIEGVWNPSVLNVSLPYEETKLRLSDLGIEIGQHHYRNDKYSIFHFAKTPHILTMNAYEKYYFMLPCHMGMTLDDAEYVAKTLWT